MAEGLKEMSEMSFEGRLFHASCARHAGLLTMHLRLRSPGMVTPSRGQQNTSYIVGKFQ